MEAEKAETKQSEGHVNVISAASANTQRNTLRSCLWNDWDRLTPTSALGQGSHREQTDPPHSLRSR